MEVKKILLKYKQLERDYGGKWKYLGMSRWECDDNKRYVQAVHRCSCDDEHCGSSPAYYIYGGPSVKEVYFEGQSFSICTSPPI